MVEQPHLGIDCFIKCALTCPQVYMQNVITCTEVMPHSITEYMQRKLCMVCRNQSMESRMDVKVETLL